MDCNQIDAMLDLLMDDALDDAQRQALEAHGQECPECAAAIHTTLQMKALFDQMEAEVDVPLEAQARWRNAVRAEAGQRRPKRLWRWIASAAAAVVVLVGVGMAFRPQDAPKQSAAPLYEVEGEAAMIEESVEQPALASNGATVNLRSDDVNGAVVEADGAVALEDAGKGMEAFKEASASNAPVGQRSPSCELTLKANDVKVACDRVCDLAQEYEAVADVQSSGSDAVNVYVELNALNAADFLSAVAALNASGMDIEAPRVTGSGQVLVLIVIQS